MADVSEELAPVGEALSAAVKSAFNDQYGIEFTEGPTVEEKDLIDDRDNMRTLGLDKFNAPCYISAVSYAVSEEAKQKDEYVGTLVLYINDEIIERVMKRSSEQRIDIEDEGAVVEGMGPVMAQVAKAFEQALSSKGFSGLIASDPVNGRNDLAEGVPFHQSQYSLVEASCDVSRSKGIVLAATMATKAMK